MRGMPLVWLTLLGLVVALVTKLPVANASTWIGLQGGQPFIHLGYVDPALPPVVVTGGSQLLVVSTEESWSLTMEALGDLVNLVEPDATIPISRLAWALHDDEPPSWAPFEAREPIVIFASEAPTSAMGQSVQIDYRFSPSFDDAPLPSQYATDLRFTLSSNLELLQSWVYPTPFRADGLDLLTIGFWLPGVGVQQLELIITDSDGVTVRRSRINLLGGEWRNVAWDGILQSGEFASPGIYHYQIVKLPQREPIAVGIIQVAHDDDPPGTSSIQGKITKADVGLPALNAQVCLYTRERRLMATACTETYGMYQFKDLPAGEYYIEASLPGYVTAQTGMLSLHHNAAEEVDLALLPNRALDFDLQLASTSVAVGDVLEADVWVTNSGTRDLLDTVVTLTNPPGFTYGGSDVGTGMLEVVEAGISPCEIHWTTGFLKQGESRHAKIWYVVGPDVPMGNAIIRGQASGFATFEKVVTPTISREVKVTKGPFIATSPPSQADCHVVLPLGDTGFFEVLLEPGAGLDNYSLPFQEPVVPKYIERNPLVSVSRPYELQTGPLTGHALRMRLDGSSQVAEGGMWRHTLNGWGFAGNEISIVGVKAATKLDDGSVLRSFYGMPQSWPIYSLHPADNTSGPFALPSAPMPWGRIDVKIISWDATSKTWQEEGQVLFRIDHTTGALTLGRAVGAFNPMGQRQYILVIYEGHKRGSKLAWKEIGWAKYGPSWGLAAGYLEAGDRGHIKLATLSGSLREDRFRLEANLRTLLGAKPRFGLKPWGIWPSGMWVDDLDGDANREQVRCDEMHKQTGAGQRHGRTAWQIIGALEPHPQIRIGGGWSMDSAKLGDFGSLTTPYKGRQDITRSQNPLGYEGGGGEGLDDLLLSLEVELLKVQRGMGPKVLSMPLARGKQWSRVLGGEVDLGDRWRGSLRTSKSSLVVPRDAPPFEVERDIAKGWEQKFTYTGRDLPSWSLGYGQKETGFNGTTEKDKSHYGFLSVGGYMERLDWGAKLTLSQSRIPYSSSDAHPIEVTAKFRAQYEAGKLSPYVQGSHQIAKDPTGAHQGQSQEDWMMGVEGRVSDQLRIDVAHIQKQDGKSSKEQLALQAAYEFGPGWSLLGTCQWPIGKAKDESHPWQGNVRLRGEIGLKSVLDVGWGRTPRQGAITDTTMDEVSIGVKTQKEQGALPYSVIRLDSTLHEGTWIAWELQGEGAWRLGGSWEAWAYGAHKQVTHNKIGKVATRQGVVRLSRRLTEKVAGFGQLGAWQQLGRGEVGYSLGMSYGLSPNMAIAAGYTWADEQRAQDTGFLSVRPGVFVQVFAR